MSYFRYHNTKVVGIKLVLVNKLNMYTHIYTPR